MKIANFKVNYGTFESRSPCTKDVYWAFIRHYSEDILTVLCTFSEMLYAKQRNKKNKAWYILLIALSSTLDKAKSLFS